MKNKIMKRMTIIIATLMVLASIPGIAYATSATVYYKGEAVNWEYGRKWGVFSYSEVQTHDFEHSATANGSFSGWKDAGEVAYASRFIGNSTARAYWDCR